MSTRKPKRKPQPGAPRRLAAALRLANESLQRAQRLAAAAELRYQILFRTSRDAVMTLSPPSWRFTSGNPATLEMFGVRDEAQFTSLEPWVLSPQMQPDGRRSAEKAREMIETAMRTGSHHFEWTHRRLEGEDFPATVLLTRVELGDETYLQARVRDISASRRAQESLLRSEQLHRQLFAAASDAFLVFDPSGKVVEVNPAACQLYGYQRHEFIGMTGEDFVSPDHAGTFQAFMEQVTTTGHFATVSKDVHKDGSLFHVEVRGSQVMFHGKPHLLAVVRDITGRKAAEEALRQSEARWRAITHSAQDAILTMDPRGAITYWNPAAESIFGYRYDEAVGRNLHELLAPERYHQLHRAAFPAFVASGFGNAVGRTLELHARRKDGQEIAVSLSLSAVLIGGEWHAVGILRDVTAQKLAEQRLRESQARLEFTLDKSGMGGWDLDLLDHTVRRTLQHDRIFGYESLLPLWTYETFLGHVIPADRAMVDRRFREATATCSDWDVECRIRRADGEVRWIWAVGGNRHDGQGQARRMAGIVQDITAHRRAEEELKQTVAALESANQSLEDLNRIAESANRAKSEFLANMSHEIRTPLTAILGFADLLLAEVGIDETTPERVEAICTIQRNGQYLLDLINDILDLSKIEAGKLDVVPVACPLVQLLAEVISLMRVRADAKGLPLTLECVGPIPESIRTDPLRLRQILINLVGNAIKFTESGRVRVVAHLVQSFGKPPSFQIDVIDSGIGLTQEQITRLFNPFSQADSSATRRFGGTGLGLTISKRLAESLGGDITVTSSSGKGSTFSITIQTGDLEKVRLLDAPAETAMHTAPRTTAPTRRLDCRILLAEDGPDNQRLIAFILRRAGAEVTVAENGQVAVGEALDARARGEPYDLVLMDMQMPVMDGYAATRRLRAEGYLAPIVALTAHAMDDDRRKCIAVGCNEYVPKPIDCQRLFDTILAQMHGKIDQAGNIVTPVQPPPIAAASALTP